MRITCVGGGPAGLYFALLMKKADPARVVRVLERNRAGDTFGWGVVLSDQTVDALREADAETADEISDAFNHWDDIAVHIGGRRIVSGGHGFCGIGRKKLLNILQARCEQLGVELAYETDVADDAGLDADLIIAADGLNSRLRQKYAATYQPDIDLRRCRFVWLGTTKLFDAFTFDFQRTEWGWFQAHAYRFDATHSTFIVEAPEEVWRAAGLEGMGKEESIAFCEKLFARVLDGHQLISNASHLRGSAQWIRFPRVVCKTWVHRNERGAPVVLMGDAAHTAHFSIGSGSKLALEDAIALARDIDKHGGDLEAALADYQASRSIEVLRIQNAARNSTEWFENVERHARLAPEQFAYSLLTRSQRISHENLRLRDAGYVGEFERWLAAQSGLDAQLPPMFTPYRLRGLTLKNRVVVSPMAQYSCVDGLPADYHLAHLGARALGGAGLVFAEMSCVSPDARITPGCPGLWSDAQGAAWQRIVGFIHANSSAKVAMQLGHAGPKGSTCVPWSGGEDRPLASGNWPLMAASEQQYIEGVSQVARAMTRADMDRVREDFVSAARRAADAGFDWLELHCAHGYLLSGFISPLTNRRDDPYGGVLANRLRYPLEVFHALREVWPEDRPMSVRISAHDWVAGGTTPEDAVAIAAAFKAAGADLIDVSSGQVSKAQKPIYGRMWQTPFAESIRNRVGIATMAVGAISEADHVNSIIASGRADLCAIARPHLANPAWTLTEAARIGYAGPVGLEWPRQYLSGKSQLEREFERQRADSVAAAEQANKALGV
ncbi:bifunctional salicylyl-CoA 5-hydroxylase/oxidoreductase [Pelomonas aquatica]|jgi:anthraniloyl-CoA monooxygenase|uniref:Bifunctional salicylyl-CoA 5-hydroxylase/oxidoreductase n=1 Tax=Pelomonas aquatica TaxID=431058 RepID=A0A9X4R575_9BURK|nr:bifunctional salicylyl-CoA 5-hydroxylase/oxidoreductase [Pelomonas aquatica]MCY4753695.1 bifunctional salicylyl-CoA 5-hydroxylase/oxidoreductase [Pelomonas aquatica]MDG0863385.1 bifunctional salicylyl-CoA 5-hydroxylase/oxidoreductase [Pelomonas aquatica]